MHFLDRCNHLTIMHLWLIDWLIDWIEFYAVSAIFQPCNSDICDIKSDDNVSYLNQEWVFFWNWSLENPLHWLTHNLFLISYVKSVKCSLLITYLHTYLKIKDVMHPSTIMLFESHIIDSNFFVSYEHVSIDLQMLNIFYKSFAL